MLIATAAALYGSRHREETQHATPDGLSAFSRLLWNA